MAPWKLPLIVAALVVPIVAGFVTVGPALGLAVGALAVLVLVLVAVGQRPRGPIGVAANGDGRKVLIVAAERLEDPADVTRVVAAAGIGDGVGERDEVRVLVPVRIGFLDRWASDIEGARDEAQRKLVATVAALAKAGVPAEARVGDEDLVQAVEDQLQAFEANEVVLVSGAEEEAAGQLRERLRSDFHRVRLGGGPQQT